ncbi:hypothetical protein ABIA55_002779 [Pseudomonas frederiksbergensis]|jgi:hypothetical protein
MCEISTLLRDKMGKLSRHLGTMSRLFMALLSYPERFFRAGDPLDPDVPRSNRRTKIGAFSYE